MLGAEGVHLRRRRSLVLGRPQAPVPPELLGERRPDGVVAQHAALAAAVGLEHHLPVVVAPGRPDDAQDAALERPTDAALDALGAPQAPGEFRLGVLDPGAIGLVEQGVLGDRLGADVHRVDEQPARREIGAGFQRLDRLGRVHRVGEDVVGVLLRGRPAGQRAEVVEVADAPRVGRAHRVELHGVTPDAPVPHGAGEAEEGRRDDERRLRPQLVGDQLDAVVAQRQVGRQLEARLAHHAPVDEARRFPVVDLGQLAQPAVLETHAEPGGTAVLDVHVDARGAARAHKPL